MPRPGEVSLADNGVLFLDELPEFHRLVGVDKIQARHVAEAIQYRTLDRNYWQ